MTEKNREAVATKSINPKFVFKTGDVIARSYDLDCQGAITSSHDENGYTIYSIHLDGKEYWINEYDAVLISRG